ncbi:magnesium-translocating P-type ATPase [Streptomyces sp. NPDC006879]|uniref:magnesium-translocating P-type ATPase n=1 Tax=Streptomyces sp. NPDC006879 TaxID=3364767 RepID=UPI0036CF68C4
MTATTQTPQEKLAPPGRRRERRAVESQARTRRVAGRLCQTAVLPVEQVFEQLDTDGEGLSHAEARRRTARHGPNTIARQPAARWWISLARAYRSPFIGMLLVLAAIMYWQDPADPGVVILSVMVTVSGLVRFWQEHRSGRAAEALKQWVTTTARVQRRGTGTETVEVPTGQVLPGDIVRLRAGDLVPADLRLLTSKDLMVSQATLSGESLPVAKTALPEPFEAVTGPHHVARTQTSDPVEAANICLLGTSVASGTATGVVLATGADTYFGSMAGALVSERPQTNFDHGVRRVSFLLIRFMLVMVPVVFAVNGLTKGDWDEALLFAIAVAVGLTPEMLPMVVSANLARGALAMSRRKVVVKQLNAIQNLGAMDVLCTDKTGTLTEDRIDLERCVDAFGRSDSEVLEYAYLNAHFQTGLPSRLDQVIIERMDEAEEVVVDARFTAVDEIPFDFARRRLSVVIRRNDPAGAPGPADHQLVTKGAVEEVLAACTRVVDAGRSVVLDDSLRTSITTVADGLSLRGLRVLAVASRTVPGDRGTPYTAADEQDLTLVGFLTFLDPPKADARRALGGLAAKGIAVKVITGDSELVATQVCSAVGVEVGQVVSGAEIDLLDESALRELASRTTVFVRTNPMQKARLVRALQADGHTVGFLGDGINDAVALHEADVGISVDTAVEVAKETADVILLEKDLTVLEQGVLQGRTTFGNTIKYIKMTASSNFGNVFSVLVASAFIPFQPMLAIHLLVQNLVYDLSQLATPWDRMDAEYLRRPRNWDARGIGRFMVTIGPISSIFDITTFLLLWHVFGANTEAHQSLFQSGWFVEGLLSQTLIVHMIRTRKIPFIQSRASWPVLVATCSAVAVGLVLPFSPLAEGLGMTALPLGYFPWLFGTLLAYCALTQGVKTWYIRRFREWL